MIDDVPYTPVLPTIESVEDAISRAERRAKRAGYRLESAQTELGDAAAALVRAREERDAYIKANPEWLL